MSTEPLPVQLLKLAAADRNREHIYMWGWVKYSDAFANTPIHLTEWCYEVYPYTITPPHVPGKTTFAVAFNNCAQHNCADNECTDYASKIKEP